MRIATFSMLLFGAACLALVGCGGSDSKNVAENASAAEIEKYTQSVQDSEAAMAEAMAAQRGAKKP